MRSTILATGLFVAGALLSLNPSPSTTHDKLQAVAQDPLQLNGIVLGENTLAVNEEMHVDIVEKSATEQVDKKEVPKEVIVIVTKGDTLSKIAKKYDTTYKRLFDANSSVSNPDVITVGQKLRVPKVNEKLTSREMPQASPVAKKRYTTYSAPLASNAPAVASGSVWDRLAACESGGNWQINTGNGYYGGLQFLPSTWIAVGGTGLPHQHSREEQIKRAEILLAQSGWGQWPQCARKIGML